MPLTRTNRMDRRRQIIRDSVDTNEEARRSTARTRRRNEDASNGETRRDAGYSQAVRKACQHRLVQLIPVRRSSLSMVITTCWVVWALFIAAHYFIHTPVSFEATSKLPAVAYLFHIRSSAGIPHWLTTQLWMLTALSALLIYQIRKHKLDDYRASYRIWLGLVAAALFASIDASSNALELIGMSIDSWTMAEFNYPGKAVVLASFASIIGVLGLRLCSELQAAKMSVGFWLGGLVAWGMSALLGTGILHPLWEPGFLDMVVGGLWLGGTLAVWMSAGIYLRHIYIHAQKRFIQRNDLLKPIQLRIPSFGLGNKNTKEPLLDSDTEERDGEERKRYLPKMPAWLNGKDKLDRQFEEIKARRNAKNGSNASSSEDAESDRPVRKAETASAKPSSERALERNGERNADRPIDRTGDKDRDRDRERDTSDRKGNSQSAAQEAKRSWLPWRKKSTKELDEGEESTIESNGGRPKVRELEPFTKIRPNDASKPDSSKSDSAKSSDEGDSNDAREDGSKKRSWLPFGSKSKKNGDSKETETKEKVRKPAATKGDSEDAPSEKKSWFKRKPTIQGDKEVAPAKPKAEKGEKKSWFASKPKEAAASDNKAKSNASEDSAPKKKGLFSFMDGLKLKPPEDASSKSSGPKPASTSREMPSTASMDNDMDDDDDTDGRQLSRAERKKLRRDQSNQRRAG